MRVGIGVGVRWAAQGVGGGERDCQLRRCKMLVGGALSSACCSHYFCLLMRPNRPKRRQRGIARCRFRSGRIPGDSRAGMWRVVGVGMGCRG